MRKFIICFSFCLVLTANIFAQDPPTPSNPEKPIASDPNKADTVKQAKELMFAARKAKSEKPLSEIKDIKITSVVKFILEGGDFEVSNETLIKFPNKTLTIIIGPFGELKNCYNGTIAWALTPAGMQEFVGDNVIEFENALAGDPICILNSFDQEKYKVEFVGEDSLEGQKMNIVLFTTNNSYEIKVYLDGKTSMIVGKSSQSKVSGSTFVNEETCSSFKIFEGVQIPMKRVIKRNGKSFIEVEVKEVKINSGIDDKIFAKPQ